MRKIVSNATPLIYLAKVRKLDLLESLYEQVLIPEEVEKEVVGEGKRIGQKDAFLIEKKISDGWINVLKANEFIEIPMRLEKGEVAALTLAKELGVKEVLIDESLARSASEIIGLIPRGTIFVLLEALKINKINFDEFMEILGRLLKEGFRLREEVYLKAIEAAKMITKQ